MSAINRSDFSGFIEIIPPLSEEQSAYINSRHFPWRITEDGRRIVAHEQADKTTVPAFWMARLIDTFLRLDPAVMKGPAEHRHGAPSFSGHICNGHIQCRAHHNIVVENNHVGKELSWPNGEIEWLNKPEPVFNAMKDYRDRSFCLTQVSKPVFEEGFDPAMLFCGGLGRKGHMIDPVLLQETYAKANEIDEWSETQAVTEITRDDVEKLKADWEADPIWDIEDTEGFEAYRDELKAFSEAKHAEWDARREEEERKRIADIQKKADRLGCSFGVAQYLTGLEDRIRQLQDQIDHIRGY